MSETALDTAPGNPAPEPLGNQGLQGPKIDLDARGIKGEVALVHSNTGNGSMRSPPTREAITDL
jgi:hypothetical protein